MIFIRPMLGAIGLLGLFGWGYLSWFIHKMFALGDSFSNGELFFLFVPISVFIFYLVIAIRPCRAAVALVVGIVLHLPLSFIVIPLLISGHEGPIFALALLPGFVVWIAYVYQLSLHHKAV